MLTIEKERLRREQDEVMKVRRNSVASNGEAPDNGNVPQEAQTKNSSKKVHPRTPPPPPPKPSARVKQGQRSEVIRLSKRPTSGDYSSVDLGNHPQQPIQKQPLSRRSLQALSAVPKANTNNADSYWMKKDSSAAKRRSDVPRKDTYSHWLIQEAEMRRIAEQAERKCCRGGSFGNLSHSKSDTNVARIGGRMPCIGDYGSKHSVEANIPRDWLNGCDGSKSSSELVTKSCSQEHCVYDEVAPRAHVPGVYSTNMLGGGCAVVSPPGGHGVNYSENTVHARGMHTEQIHGEYPIYGDVAKMASTSKMQDNMLSVSGRKKCSNCSEELGKNLVPFNVFGYCVLGLCCNFELGGLVTSIVAIFRFQFSIQIPSVV